MATHTRPGGAIIAMAVFAAFALAATSSRASAADPLADVPFAVATDVLFDEARNDGRQGQRGSWSLDEGQLTNGHLNLHFEIDPPRQGLPVMSGPAVLFAGMQAYGGAGDVGIGEPMKALASAVIPACDDNDCHFSADIDLPADEIANAVRRLEQRADLMWVSVELTLVRTFGAGQWLQVLPLQGGSEGGVGGEAGRLGSIQRTEGTLFPFGLFPAEQATPIPKGGGWMFTTGFDYGRSVERLLKQTADASAALPTVDAGLRVDISPTCEHAAHLTLHDDAGDRVFDAEAFGRSRVEGAARLPIGVPWRLTLQDGGGIDFDQGRQGWGVRIGNIESDGSPVEIDATFDCSIPAGSLEVAGGVAPAPPPKESDETVSSSDSGNPPTSTAVLDDSAFITPAGSSQTSGDSAGPVISVAVLILGGLAAVLFARRSRRRL